MSANILRCFEECETPWLWVLGDDDEPLPTAVATILRSIREHGECTFLNFSSPVSERHQAYETRGLADFIERLDSFGNTLFISAGVYKAETIRRNLRIGYHYAYSMAPHIACLLASLGGEGRCFMSADQITKWETNNRGDHWSSLDVALGAMVLMELPFPFELKRKLVAKMRDTVHEPSTFFGEFWCCALAGCVPESRYLFDQLVARNAPFIGGIRAWARVTRQCMWLHLPASVLKLLYMLRHPVRRVPDAASLEQCSAYLKSRVSCSVVWDVADAGRCGSK